MPRFFSFNRYDSDIEHWAQSEYARQFLKINGVADEKIFTVTDFLDNIFFEVLPLKNSAKKNLIAYRQIKGSDFTDIVKELASGVEWQAVEDLTPAVAQKLFLDAKIYVDFGEHPAKEKLVREAAISNCVVITSKHGAAANDIDINISAEFKFEETIKDAVKAADKIQSVLQDFEVELSKQKNFRERILREKYFFVEQIKSALEISKSPNY
jgi:predicted nucleotidyltransferase